MGGVLGKPNPQIRRIKVVAFLTVGLVLFRRWGHSPPAALARFSALMRGWSPLQIVLGWSMVGYLIKNTSLLLGLNAPDHNVPYNDNFFRSIWVLTALNAAFITATQVQQPILRHLLTAFLVPYFLIFHEDAENRMHRYRQCSNVHQIRASFEGVPKHPLLQYFMSLSRPPLGVWRRRVLLPRRSLTPQQSSTASQPVTSSSASASASTSAAGLPGNFDESDAIECFVYYRGRAEEMHNCTRVLLQFHGGGFVAMDPQCHEDYMNKIAMELDAVVVSVNYRKAPEHPYPGGLNDCFDVYEQLRDDNGRCVGLHPAALASGFERPLTIVLMGDSAGGNLVAAVCLRVLLINQHAQSEAELLRAPDGCHLIYPSLSFDTPFWRTADILHADDFQQTVEAAAAAAAANRCDKIEVDDQRVPLHTEEVAALAHDSKHLAAITSSSPSSSALTVSSTTVSLPSANPSSSGAGASGGGSIRRSASHARFQPLGAVPPLSHAVGLSPSSGGGSGGGMRRSSSHARFSHHFTDADAAGSASAVQAAPNGGGELILTSLTRPASYVSLISLVHGDEPAAAAATAAPAGAASSGAVASGAAAACGGSHLHGMARVASYSSLAAAAAAIEPVNQLAAANSRPLSSSSASSLSGLAKPAATPIAAAAGKSAPFSSSPPSLITQLPPLPMFASHVRYVNDRILGPNRVVAMAECYLANGGDPAHDMFLSPLIAPAHLLAHFPRCFIHVGEVDPLVDDSVLFCKRLRQARADRAVRLHIFPGISHAYMHLGLLLPETRRAIALSIEWLRELFDAGVHH